MPRSDWRKKWLIAAFFCLPMLYLAGLCLWSNERLVITGNTPDQIRREVTNSDAPPLQQAVITTVYSRGPFFGKVVFAIGCGFIYYAVYVLFTLLVMKPTNKERVIHLVIWTLGPPAYFFAEWFIFYPLWGDMRGDVIESLKHGQEICRDLWGAFVALFGALHIAESLKKRLAGAADEETEANSSTKPSSEPIVISNTAPAVPPAQPFINRMKQDTVVSVCALVVSICAVIVSVRQDIHERDLKRIDALVELNRFLHEPAISDARLDVRMWPPTKPISITYSSVHKVCSSFDFAAFLVHKGDINPKDFLEYWHIPLEILGHQLGPIWEEECGGGYRVRDYYGDFYKILMEARIAYPPKHPVDPCNAQIATAPVR